MTNDDPNQLRLFVPTYLTQFRRQGIARKMMEILTDELPGQHVYLFTDDSIDFYKKLGFKEQATGLGKVIGKWLVN